MVQQLATKGIARKWKSMKNLMLLLAIFVIVSFRPSADGLRLVKSFAKDVKNVEKSFGEIIESYLCHFSQENYKAKAELTNMQLAELRKMLMNAEVQVGPYSKVPAEEQTVQLESAGTVYQIRANGKHVCFVLTDGERILSFSTMRKGENGSQNFITFCK